MRSSARSLLAPRRALFLAFATTIASASFYAGCGGDSTNNTTSTGSAGGTTTSTTTSSTTTSGSGGSGGGTTSSTTTSSTTSSTTSTTSSTSAGTGGGPGWPTCDMPEPGAVQKTIHEIYVDNPAQPTQVWVPGVYVTAVSQGGCVAGTACQIFVQQDLSYSDLTAGSGQAIKLFVSANTATHFTQVQVGQKVDIDAWAWRYNVNQPEELLLQVNLQNKGCAKVVGSGDAQPLTVGLTQLMFANYDTVGPLLVKVLTPSGTPQAADQTFGLFIKGSFVDAGVDNVVSLSPYFLSGGTFGAFTAANYGHINDFTFVTGVFGVFVPMGSMQRYREIYPRTAAEYPVAKIN